MTTTRAWMTALLAALPTAAPAQPNTAPAAPAAQASAAAAGMRIATQGAQDVAPCASCHGAAGEGNAAAGFPRTAGQSAGYLQRQLDAYASGARQNPVMAPIAKALDPSQRRAVAAWYASRGTVTTAGAAARAASAATAAAGRAAQRGARLASVGDESSKVQACANCHGPGGIGQAPDYPALAGQNARYLSAALAEWKSGARKTDPSGQMVQIAQALAPGDVEALSAYFASRPVAPPRALDVATRWSAPKGIAVVSGPRRDAVPGASGAAQGVGTEQGAPLTGGGQGPGGGGGASGGGAQGSKSGDSATGATRR